MKGTYINTKFDLFVPGKKGLQQPGGSLPPPNLDLSRCLSPLHTCTCARTRVHARAHALPKDGVARARQPCWLEGVPWSLFWSRGCIQEDSKPCEIVLLPEGGT